MGPARGRGPSGSGVMVRRLIAPDRRPGPFGPRLWYAGTPLHGACTMRVCRIGPEATPRAAFYFDTHVVPVATAVVAHSQARGTSVHLPTRDDLVPLLLDPSVRELNSVLTRTPNAPGAIPIAQAELLVPVAKPGKLFCLAGNYAEHVKE